MSRRNTKGLAGILAGLLLAGAIAACDADHQSISGPQSIQYTLTSIDSNPLPYQISQSSDGTVKTVLDDMVLSISEDRTWHSVGHQIVTTNGVPGALQLLQNSGTYVPDVTTTFRDAAGNVLWAGLVTENVDSLTTGSGQVWVFQR